MKIKIVEYEDSGWAEIYLNGEEWYKGNNFDFDFLEELLKRLDCEVERVKGVH